MTQKTEFLTFAMQESANIRQLCRRYGISAKTGYKWLRRYKTGGAAALQDQSRRPKSSPRRCAETIEASVLELRRTHPAWGGRKLRRRLQDLQVSQVPAASTCTEILRRAELLCPEQSTKHTAFKRFERGQPNELWQMDFKGHFAMQNGKRCHGLTGLDDRSRFNVMLSAEPSEHGHVVKEALTTSFTIYGLPEGMLCDNGSPWGCAEQGAHSALSVWLLRLGIRIYHGRPYHPQTQGKEERFHRTLHEELISQHTWRDLAHCAELFHHFRESYNCERPHDALNGDTPLSHYRPSPRSMPNVLPALEYFSDMIVRTVRDKGAITFHNQTWYIGRAFAGLSIGLRPSPQADGQWFVYFSHHRLGVIDLRTTLLPKHTAHSINKLGSSS